MNGEMKGWAEAEQALALTGCHDVGRWEGCRPLLLSTRCWPAPDLPAARAHPTGWAGPWTWLMQEAHPTPQGEVKPWYAARPTMPRAFGMSAAQFRRQLAASGVVRYGRPSGHSATSSSCLLMRFIGRAMLPPLVMSPGRHATSLRRWCRAIWTGTDAAGARRAPAERHANTDPHPHPPFSYGPARPRAGHTGWTRGRRRPTPTPSTGYA